MIETNIINIGPFVVTFLITLSVAVFALGKRSVEGGGAFSLWAFILAFWNLGYIFKLASQTLKGKIFWDDLQTSLVALFPLAFLLFALQYSRRKPRRMSWIWAILILLAAGCIALIWSNSYHRLINREEWLIPGAPYSDLGHQYAPLTFVMFAVFTLVLLAGISLLIQRLFDPHWIYRAQVATIIIGILLCLAGIVLTILDYPIYLHRDNSPFANSIASLIIAFGLFRYRLFDLTPIGREVLINQLEDVVVVEDLQNRVVDLNPAALKKTGKKASQVIGRSASEVFGESAQDIAKFRSQLEGRAESISEDAAGKIYKELRFFPLRDKDARLRGRLIVIRDITTQKKAEQVLSNSRNELKSKVKERTRELEKAMETLRESEARFHSMVQNSSDAIGIFNRETEFIYGSASAERITGYPTEEFVGRKALDLIHPEDRDLVARAITKVISNPGSLIKVEYRFLKKDGSYIWLESTGTNFLDDPLIAGIVVNSRDITERKRAEEALRESEEKYRQLVETTNTGFTIIDAEGRVLDANDEYMRLTGHRNREEILGRKVTEWTAEHDQARNLEAVKECVSKGFIRNLEIDYKGRDGRTTPVEINATVIGSGDELQVLTLCRDISERKQAEQRLKDSEEKYRFLVNNIASIAWTSDVNGNTTFISPNVEKIYGYTPEEICSSGDELWFGRIHPEDLERVKQAVIEAFASRTGFDIEYRIQRKDGKWIWLHDVGMVTRNDQGKEFAYGVFSEITEQKDAEQALKESEEKYRSLFEFAPGAIIITDLNGKILDTNEYYKIPREMNIGKQFTEIGSVHPDDIELIKESFKRLVRGEEVTPIENKSFSRNARRALDRNPFRVAQKGRQALCRPDHFH